MEGDVGAHHAIRRDGETAKTGTRLRQNSQFVTWLADVLAASSIELLYGELESAQLSVQSPITTASCRMAMPRGKALAGMAKEI
jgi:hypothetical protein